MTRTGGFDAGQENADHATFTAHHALASRGFISARDHACGGFAAEFYLLDNGYAEQSGGDEFGLVLEDLDAEGAEAKAHSLATSIAAEPLDGTSVSISIGYTLVGAGDSIDSIIARADAAMYVRKRARHLAL